MKNREHKILDHPILGYFLLALFVMVLEGLFSLLDLGSAALVPAYEPVARGTGGPGLAMGALVAAVIFTRRFKPEFKGCFAKKQIIAGLIMLLPMLIVHYAGSVVSWTEYGTAGVLTAFLMATAPGVGEEITFRALGVANYMRTIKDERKIPVIFWLSSLVFGLFHLANILAGGNVFACVLQAVYAIGIGMAFAAVYLRTGNIWPTMIAHFSLDLLELIRADLGASGGVMVGMGIGDWITIAAGLIGAVIGLRLIDAKYYPEIMKVWDEKWSRA